MLARKKRCKTKLYFLVLGTKWTFFGVGLLQTLERNMIQIRNLLNAFLFERLTHNALESRAEPGNAIFHFDLIKRWVFIWKAYFIPINKSIRIIWPVHLCRVHKRANQLCLELTIKQFGFYCSFSIESRSSD